MAFYKLLENADKVSIRLTKGNAIFHFILFRVYPWILILIGLTLAFVLIYESHSDYWLVVVSLLPMVIAFLMLWFRYVVAVEVDDQGIHKISKDKVRGNVERYYHKSTLRKLICKENTGKGGGLSLLVLDNQGEIHEIFKIPRMRLNTIQALKDFKKCAEKLGMELELSQ